MNHLAVIYRHWFDKMLNGEKVIELRMSKVRQPWLATKGQDIIYAKHKGFIYGKMTATFVVHWNAEKLTGYYYHEFLRILDGACLNQHRAQIIADIDERPVNYITSIQVCDVQLLPTPIKEPRARYRVCPWATGYKLP